MVTHRFGRWRFRPLERANDPRHPEDKTRAELLSDIESNLIPHAKWEEEVFYPAFAERADRDGLKTHAEAIQEHRAVELTVLPDLKAAQTTTPEFAGRAKVLSEFVDHHAKEEESTMFKMARKLFTAEERAELDEQYETWKASPDAAAAMVTAQAKSRMKAVVRTFAS